MIVDCRGLEGVCRGCMTDFRDRENVEAMRVILEVKRVFTEAVSVIIEAVSVIIEAVKKTI